MDSNRATANHLLWAVLISVALPALLAGCGGSDASTPLSPSVTPPPSPQALPAGTTVSVVSGEDHGPVEGARVVLGTQEYLTDAAGRTVLAESSPYGSLADIVAAVSFRDRISDTRDAVFVLVVIGIGLDQETNERYTQGIIDVQKTTRKPFIMVGIPGFGEEIISRFCNAGVPFFDSAERAMQTYAQVCRYQDWQCRMGANTESDTDLSRVVQ